MLTAWGDSTEEDEGTEEEDAVVALMAKSDSNLRIRYVVSIKQNLKNYYSL